MPRANAEGIPIIKLLLLFQLQQIWLHLHAIGVAGELADVYKRQEYESHMAKIRVKGSEIIDEARRQGKRIIEMCIRDRPWAAAQR